MTYADINDLETRDYIFKIGDRGKGIQARYDENTDVLIFPRAAFDYVCELIKEALSQQPCDDAISRDAVEQMIKAEMPERGAWEIGGNIGDIEKQTVCEVCVDLLQELNDLPSVTKSGKCK